MERNTFWILLAIGVAFGIGLELIKNSAPDSNRIKSLADRDYEMVDDRIDNLEAARAGRIAGAAQAGMRGMQVAVIPGAVGETLADATAATAPTAPQLDANGNPIDPKAAAEAKKKEDEKKKAQAKKDEKKKKKKKKKKKVVVPGAEEETETDEDEEEAPADDSRVAQTNAQVPVGGVLTLPPPIADDAPQSQRDWENLVLTQPDFQATEKLINAFLTNQVSAEIFYNVVRQMTNSNNQRLRQLGVMALGVTPSVRSFAELSNLIQSEPSGVTPIKTQAQEYLVKYTELGYVRLLAGAMQMKDSPHVVLQAMRIFRIAADLNLRQRAQNARDPAETAAQNGQGSKDLASENGQNAADANRGGAASTRGQVNKRSAPNVFRPFLILLRRLENMYSRQELRSEASQTLAFLERLLPSVPGTAASDPSVPGTNPPTSQPTGAGYLTDGRYRR